ILCQMTSVDLLKLVDPSLYYERFIEGGMFPDGRAIDAFKPFSFKRGVVGGVVAGSALVRQGGVTVVCSLTASLAPLSTEPSMVVEFDGTPDENEAKMALMDARTLLEDLIARDAFVARRALTSTDDRLEWRLQATFKLLHSDGDLAAAVVGSLLAALTDARLPPVLLQHAADDEAPIEPSEIKIEKEESKWAHIELSSFPVASTFMLHVDEEGQMHLLADPPVDARQLCKSHCTIVIGKKKENSSLSILALRSAGSCCDDLLRRMVGIAEKRQETIVKALEKKD
ncbi:hypothetical protein PFISCL1PPCAC_28913, partial [Pristionchus fissidentatus]